MLEKFFLFFFVGHRINSSQTCDQTGWNIHTCTDRLSFLAHGDLVAQKQTPPGARQFNFACGALALMSISKIPFLFILDQDYTVCTIQTFIDNRNLALKWQFTQKGTF